jgi:hypothetical protein
VSVTPQPRFTSKERTPGTHCTGGWVGPRVGLDTEARGKILSPLPGIETHSPGRPVCGQRLYWLSYPSPVRSTCSHPSHSRFGHCHCVWWKAHTNLPIMRQNNSSVISALSGPFNLPAIQNFIFVLLSNVSFYISLSPFIFTASLGWQSWTSAKIHFRLFHLRSFLVSSQCSVT